MVRILGIVGSSRKDGNTSILIDRALKVAKGEGADVETIFLVDKNIKPCTGCEVCTETKDCPIEDDAKDVYNEIMKADGIIVGSPVHFGSVTPEVKTFIDRAGYLARAQGYPFKDKIAGALAVATRSGFLTTLTQIHLFFLYMKMIIPGAGWTTCSAKKRGEALKDAAGLKRAEELGRRVALVAKKLQG